MSFERELAAARHIAAQAGALALDYQRRGVEIEDKADDSPVTIADKECEKLITRFLLETFPDDGILGEEGAEEVGRSGRRWIIDPIDGTRDFVRGNRLFANLIGLEKDGEPVVGVVNLPGLNEMYYAARGEGAFRDGTRLSISKITSIEKAVACVNGLSNAANRPNAERLLPFMARFWSVRSLGGALDAMFVCAGHAELWIEPTAKPWDLAAIRVIARESGVCFFDSEGRDTIYSGNAMMCVPALEAAAREFVGLSS